jgi:hypothetical protein
MAMGKNESIECTTSMPVLVPQVLPVGTIPRRGKRELASLGVTRGLEQPSEPQRRQTRSSSRSSAETKTPLLPASTGSKKTKTSNSRSATAAAAGRNKSRCRESTTQKTAWSKRRSISSETVVTVVSKKVTVSSPSSGRGYRRRSARVSSSLAIPVVEHDTRAKVFDSTTCNDSTGMHAF